MPEKKPIYVVGHRNPDTDSVCSAIAYARLKQALGVEDVVAARAGEINAETKYALETFRVDLPYLLQDIYPRVRDVMLPTPVPLFMMTFCNIYCHLCIVFII